MPFTGNLSQLDSIPDTHVYWDKEPIGYGANIVPEKGQAMQRIEAQQARTESAKG